MRTHFRFRKALAFLLAALMILGMAPAMALGAGAADSSTSDAFYRIVHLDCGRKYFTADWIKALITEMKAAGYTHLELAIGNDGLRFLLDDMSVTANDTSYSSANVTAGIRSGNKAYHDFGTNELTQTEMDGIIAHAKSVGIEIIPLINTPGHMDAIVTCLQNLGVSTPNYNGSDTTIDLSNSTAVAFTQALVAKYAAYFAGKGCTIFNMGCDEYANDVYSSGSMGFGNLVSTGKYGSFVTYVNELAAIVKNAGMTPMAFNDGFYFNGNTSSGTFDTDIMISFWTSGWSGYQSESASALAARGHKMINTNGDYYYVLGKNDQWDSNGYTYAANFSNTAFMGSTVSNPAGSMYCIWCDYPNAETETVIAANNRMILRAMAARMQGNDISTINDSNTVIVGGFAPDGSIYTGSGDEELTFTDDENGISITAKSGLSNVELTYTGVIDEAAGTASVTWSINITGFDGNPYTDGATIKVLLSKYSEWFGNCKPDSFTGNVGEDSFTVTQEDGYLVFTVPHFSDVTVTGELHAEGEVVPDATITIEVGETTTVTQSDVNNKDNVDRTNLNEGIATVEVTGVDAVEATTTYTQASVTCNTLISGNSNSWQAVSGYYYKADDGNYYPVYAKRSSSGFLFWSTYTYTWGYSTTSSTGNVTQIGTQETDSTSTTPNITVYTRSTTDPTPASTTITITGVYPGTTYVTVGDTTYAIVVNYKTENVAVVVGGTTTSTQSAVISGAPEYSEEGIVTATVSGNTVTFTGVAVGNAVVTVGNTRYTVNVTEEDLTTVGELSIEYWITNGRPTDANGNNAYAVSAEGVGINTENGIDVTSFMPVNTTKVNRTLQFWRCRLLDKTLSNTSTSGTEEQTETSGDDDTYNGTGFTKVRYWNGDWVVYTENNEWVNVTSDHQLVAYYLEILPVAAELTVTAADWGKKGDGSTSGDYLEPGNSCTVSIQVIYEDGTTNPAGTTADDLASSTIAYGYWTGGRGVGTLNLTGLEGYQIWKIEAETGAMTYASTSSTWGSFTVKSFEWDDNAVTVYEGEPVDSYIIHNDSNNPSTDGYYANLMWNENHEAILIKAYVKTVETEDTLTVHYIDNTTNQEFYNYNINVKSGFTFNEGISLADPWKGALANGSVTNNLGVTRPFQLTFPQCPRSARSTVTANIPACVLCAVRTVRK